MKLYLVVGAGLAILLSACGSSQDEAKPTTEVEAVVASSSKPANEQSAPMTVDVSQVKAIIKQRCAVCHSAKPTDDLFKVAPGNVMFDSIEQIQSNAARIRARAVDSQTMPFMNKTQMTDRERSIIGQWIKAGAPTG